MRPRKKVISKSNFIYFRAFSVCSFAVGFVITLNGSFAWISVCDLKTWSDSCNLLGFLTEIKRLSTCWFSKTQSRKESKTLATDVIYPWNIKLIRMFSESFIANNFLIANRLSNFLDHFIILGCAEPYH